MLTEWLSVTPMIILGLALMFLPGVLVLRIAGFRGTLMAAGAVPVSFGIVAVSGMVADKLNVPWGMAPLVTGTFAVGGFAWVGARTILGKLPTLVTPAVLQRPKYASAIALGTVVWASVVSATAIITARAPNLPVQQIDATFHQSLPWMITQTGNASILTAAGQAMGLRAIETYYPMIWHIYVATIGGPEHIIEATNVMLVLFPVAWFMGIGALALEAFPKSRWAPAVAVSAALLFPAYPAYTQINLPIWPNALGIAVMPSVVALLLRCLRLLDTLTDVGRRRALVASLGFLLAFLGAVATYPVTLFATLFLIIPLIGGILLRLREMLISRYGRKASFLATSVVTLIVASGFLLLAIWKPHLINFLKRDSYASFSGVIPKLKAIVTMWPAGGGAPGIYVTYLMVIAIITVGLFTTLTRRKQRWIFWSWIIAFILLSATYFPLGPITSLTGWWYNAPIRVIPLLILPTVLMAASIWQRLETKLIESGRISTPRRLALICALGILGFSVIAPLTTSRAWTALMLPETDRAEQVLVHLATDSELNMLQRLRGELDPKLMVLGDPANGSTFVAPIAGVRPVFPHLSYRSLDTDALYLAHNFRFIEQDEKVCHILRHYGIGYYYQDQSGKVAGIDPEERSPGLYNVDTTRGFELIDSADTAKVYKITACGNISRTSTWKTLGKGFEPLFDEHGNRNQFHKDGKLILPGQKP